MPEAVVADARPVLPALYYLHNFEALWRVVDARYADLLLPEELAQMRRFEALPQAARCLFVRLVLRVGPVFRVGRLHYVEIGDIDSALAPLIDSDLASDCAALDIDTMARLFTRAEIRHGHDAELVDLPLPNKPALLAAVEGLGESDAARAQRLCEALDERLIRIEGGATVTLLQLLFFGNSHQSLVDFVLSDLGVACYWPYALSRTQRVFSSREALDVYRQADALAERHAQWREVRDADALLALAVDALGLASSAETVMRRIHRLRNRIARDCERQGLSDTALELYAHSEQHPARERRLRVLEAKGAANAALAFASHILAQPWCEDEQAAVTTIRQRDRKSVV